MSCVKLGTMCIVSSWTWREEAEPVWARCALLFGSLKRFNTCTIMMFIGVSLWTMDACSAL